ncbi:flotillin domain-containing protein [Candidatus Riflebacteria bacterium]
MEAKGQADSILMKYEAEAEGQQKVLESKARGYFALVKSCDGDAKAAATFLLTEKLEELVASQVEAVKNLKIDRITVWDSGNGKDSSTSNFISSMVRSLPPLQEIAANAGLELPEYLGKMKEDSTGMSKSMQQRRAAKPVIKKENPKQREAGSQKKDGEA